MNILMIGDIVGHTGRKAVQELLPKLKREYDINLVVANGENAAGGKGITGGIADELFSLGVDFITMGNHVWDNKAVFEIIDIEPRIIRPANYPPGTPGSGHAVLEAHDRSVVGIINLSGRVYLGNLDCPFRTADYILQQMLRRTPIILIDFHAEATSEKVAFGWYVDGKVSAVCGTHTHVQTADARILPKGTAFITDVGMTGPRDSVLGVKTELVISKFVSQMPSRFEVASGPAQLNAVVLEIDNCTGRCKKVETIQRNA